MSEPCSQEIVLSQDYTEFLTVALSITPELLNLFRGVCYQQIDPRYFTIYTPVNNVNTISLNQFFYNLFPKLYGEMSTAALEISGITRIASQPVLNLKGQGVLIGIADSGIDFTHPAFRDSHGRTRILRLWDQTDPTGPAPEGISYGTEYTEDDINLALASSSPSSIVRERDSSGHGTFLAGVAAGSQDLTNNFSGAAPESRLIVVKLKPAKNFLRDFYFISPDAAAYQENDIMLAINYIRRCASELGLPISIPFGLGSNLGGHDGYSSLSNIINSTSKLPGFCITAPTGNEGNSRQHCSGVITDTSTPSVIEFSVSPDVPGIFMELWGQAPALLSISIQSPTGESTGRIFARPGDFRSFRFIFDRSRITVYHDLTEFDVGDEVIDIRIQDPTEGIWKISVYSNTGYTSYDAYFPGSSMIGENAYFLTPDPDITLTDPSGADSILSVSGYDPISGAFYPESGRGFTRSGRYKPDICAPCTAITGPNLHGGYEMRSGTSAASALTGGACAQLLTWAVTNENLPLITSSGIKSLLIRGATRMPGTSYPSRQWGYGTLDVYNAFEVLRLGGNNL